MTDKSLHFAYILMEASNKLMVEAAPATDANKIDRAIKALTQAQSNVASSIVRLQSAAKAIDKIEPFLGKKAKNEVNHIEAFRKYYSEISSKLNKLTQSLAAVNGELMALSTNVEEPAPAPAQEEMPQEEPAAAPEPAKTAAPAAPAPAPKAAPAPTKAPAKAPAAPVEGK